MGSFYLQNFANFFYLMHFKLWGHNPLAISFHFSGLFFEGDDFDEVLLQSFVGALEGRVVEVDLRPDEGLHLAAVKADVVQQKVIRRKAEASPVPILNHHPNPNFRKVLLKLKI